MQGRKSEVGESIDVPESMQLIFENVKIENRFRSGVVLFF